MHLSVDLRDARTSYHRFIEDQQPRYQRSRSQRQEPQRYDPRVRFRQAEHCRDDDRYFFKAVPEQDRSSAAKCAYCDPFKYYEISESA